MKVGTRVLYPEEVDLWDAEILQISVYRGMKDNLKYMRLCADACRKAGKRYVIHPVRYSLFEEKTFSELREMAGRTDLSLILHDERTPEGSRLDRTHQTQLRGALEKLKSFSPVSIENASHTGDVTWFWNTFADSITLDIGHIESFGMNSPDFVRSLDDSIIQKIQFVHMHRNNGLRGGITDHWPLVPDCREMTALKRLLRRKRDIRVILEINEVEETDGSLRLLRSVRNDLDV